MRSSPDTPLDRDEATSPRQRYSAWRAREIEFYKQVVPHRTLMQLAETANQRMQSRGALVLGDLTLAFEVNDVVAERLRLPSFSTWSRRLCRTANVKRSWSGRTQQMALAIPDVAAGTAVLLLQPRAGDLWEALSAGGRRTVVVEPDDDERDRLHHDADRNGWGTLVSVLPSLDAIPADEQFASVCYSPAACADLAEWETDDMIDTLQQRTVPGGVHVVDGLLRDRGCAPRAMLRRRYAAWSRRIQRSEREWTLVAARNVSAVLANQVAPS